VLPAARRFNDLGVEADTPLPELAPLDTAARPVTAPELAAAPGPAALEPPAPESRAPAEDDTAAEPPATLAA
jgi:hypothetical protein